MKIENIKFRNFLSYGNNLTEYNFDSIETILISGKNGVGKTTLIDVLCFNITGRSYRDVTLDQIINSKNNKKLETEGNYVSSTGTKVKIIRNRKPNEFKLFINEKEQDQTSSKDFQTRIEKILECSYNTLKKTFLISSVNYLPFFKSSLIEKRKLIDQLMEIESFSKMSDSIKKDRTIEKEKLKEVEYEIDKLKSNIDIIEKFNRDIDKSNEDNDITEQLTELDKQIENIKVQATELKSNKEKNQNKLDEIVESTNKLLEKDLKQLTAINNLRNDINIRQSNVNSKKNELDKKNSFFNDNAVCVTCEQTIDDKHKEKVKWEIEQQILSLDEDQFDVDNINKKLEKYISKNDQLKETIQINQLTIKNLQNIVEKDRENQTKLKFEYQSIQTKKDTLKSSHRTEVKKKDTTDLLKELNKCHEEKLNVVKKLDIIETSVKMLGEKYLRSFVISKYLPKLNKSLNKYLEIFGLPFKIMLDKEFKENFLSKHYEKLSYNSLSEGEKKRVDLSLIFAFFDLSKMKSKQTSNVLLMDEVADSSLDVEAISGLSHIINLLTEEKINVIIISHNGDIKNLINFTKHLEVFKKEDFSNIKEI